MKTILTLILCVYVLNVQSQTLVPAVEIQISGAVMAAPEESRAEATVLGFNQAGELVMLKEGSNELICLADDPSIEGFNVACYHQDLEPFMKRGRELKAEGLKGKQVDSVRTLEVESGQLIMPSSPSTLYVLSADAKDYDSATGEVGGTYLRYVIYTPFSTAQSSGLPIRPHAPGMPWIMDPGTPHAHIMISPAPNK